MTRKQDLRETGVGRKGLLEGKEKATHKCKEGKVRVF